MLPYLLGFNKFLYKFAEISMRIWLNERMKCDVKKLSCVGKLVSTKYQAQGICQVMSLLQSLSLFMLVCQSLLNFFFLTITIITFLKWEKGKLMEKLFSASRGAPSLFTSDWARLLIIMLLWEGCQSSVQRTWYRPSLSREERVKKPYCRTQHAAHTGFELTTLGSWVRSSTAEAFFFCNCS